MINAEKTQLMAKAVLYEKNEGRETLRLRNIFKSESAAASFFRFVPLGLGVALLIMFLIIIGEHIINEEGLYLFERGPAEIAVMAAGVIFFAVLYAFINYRSARRTYENVRSSMREYDLGQNRIEELEMLDMEDADY